VFTRTDIARWRGRGRLVSWLALTALIVAAPLAGARAERGAGGPEELFRLGVKALNESRYADAASMFRLSNDMERSVETTCNLALTYDRWAGHDAQAIETYQACAAEDTSGRFRPHAEERIAALRARALPTSAPPVAAPPSAPPGPQVMPVAVTWRVTSNTPSCFFFSGPGGLGRRDQLGTVAQWAATGPNVSLTFQGGQSFVGTRSGPQVSLSRRSTHSFSGTWVVDETILGSFDGNTFVGAYQYRECQPGNARNCPTNCTIQAQVSAVPAR
jgi:hypothetical protein